MGVKPVGSGEGGSSTPTEQLSGYTKIESSADETWTNDNVLKAIPGWEVDVEIGDTIEGFQKFIVTSDPDADLKTKPTGGGTLTGSHGENGLQNTINGLASGASESTRSATEKSVVYIPYVITNAGSAGTIVFNAAQLVANANTTTVHKGSILYWRKVK